VELFCIPQRCIIALCCRLPCSTKWRIRKGITDNNVVTPFLSSTVIALENFSYSYCSRCAIYICILSWSALSATDLHMSLGYTFLLLTSATNFGTRQDYREMEIRKKFVCSIGVNFRLRFHLCNYACNVTRALVACVGATVCKRRGMRKMGAQGVDAR
jgi:hypothetical protein